MDQINMDLDASSVMLLEFTLEEKRKKDIMIKWLDEDKKQLGEMKRKMEEKIDINDHLKKEENIKKQ